MKSIRQYMLPLFTTLLVLSGASVVAAEAVKTFEQNKPLRIALVSFKTCVEKSKMGIKEQANFEAMKKQMETVMEGKEKALSDVTSKFNDIDYLDSLSPDAEADLKRQFRTLNQEFNQQQQQFYQTLSQTNMMIIQKLTDAVTKASTEVAKANNIDVVLNEESCFFAAPAIDISTLIIRALDDAFEKDLKDNKVAK